LSLFSDNAVVQLAVYGTRTPSDPMKYCHNSKLLQLETSLKVGINLHPRTTDCSAAPMAAARIPPEKFTQIDYDAAKCSNDK